MLNVKKKDLSNQKKAKEERIKIKHNTGIKNPVKKTHHQKSKTNCYLGKTYPRCMTYKM